MPRLGAVWVTPRHPENAPYRRKDVGYSVKVDERYFKENFGKKISLKYLSEQQIMIDFFLVWVYYTYTRRHNILWCGHKVITRYGILFLRVKTRGERVP